MNADILFAICVAAMVGILIGRLPAKIRDFMFWSLFVCGFILTFL